MGSACTKQMPPPFGFMQLAVKTLLRSPLILSASIHPRLAAQIWLMDISAEAVSAAKPLASAAPMSSAPRDLRSK